MINVLLAAVFWGSLIAGIWPLLMFLACMIEASFESRRRRRP